jgi:hypothetical protein
VLLTNPPYTVEVWDYDAVEVVMILAAVIPFQQAQELIIGLEMATMVQLLSLQLRDTLRLMFIGAWKKRMIFI